MASTYNFLRYLMMAFNVVFFLCGVGVLVAGIIVRVDRKDRLLYLEVCDKFDYHAASYITIASGLFIIIVSGLGLIGTLRESRSLLLSFICCLFTLFLIEVTIGILSAVYKTEMGNELKVCMNGTLVEYYADENLRNSWDEIQVQLSCCGVNGGKDYRHARNRQFNVTSPKSCEPNADKGCYSAIKDKASDDLVILAVVAAVITLVELIGIAMALWLVCKISEKYHT
ncbi:leukocyte surface antigen CD53-like [Dendronephthya gigantea]|uniref:leukocyte surface antigen CD53-like n=1 Tax=Dendronephthya gigantea TaxID=151771 RepID=UPI00106AC4C6|nr:leukocyte surface antigen CD53-like [Dendronephthya gigantea]